MADEVPAGSGTQGGDLGGGLLDVVLAEIHLAGGQGCGHGLGGVALGDGHQADFPGLAAHRAGGGVHAGADGGQVLGDAHRGPSPRGSMTPRRNSRSTMRARGRPTMLLKEPWTSSTKAAASPCTA